MDAFQVIDKHSKGWVTAPEISEALADFGSFPHKEDVYLFVRRYDLDSDGRLLYSDFCDAFTPQDTLSAQILTKRPANYLQMGFNRINFFARDTRELLMRAFRTHFSIEETAELLRKRLSRRPQFSVHDAFTTLDGTDSGYLTANDLQRLLLEHRVFMTAKELQLLFLRFDRNKDGRISYSEFMEEMIPKSSLKA